MDLKWQIMANDVCGRLTRERIYKFGPPFCQVSEQSGKATENKQEALICCI